MDRATVRYEVLQGEISQLHVEDAHAHYLENIKHQRQMVATATVGDAGTVGSIHTATYEGDPVVGFVMHVAGKTVRGSLWKTSFKNGDHVNVIGQERNGIFEAVAVTKPDERMIWMQPHCERGTRSQKRNLLRCSGWFVLFMTLCAIMVSLFEDSPAWLTYLSFLISSIIILGVTVGMSWGDFMIFSTEMNAVGMALEFAEPEEIDLFKSTKQARRNGRPELPIGVYYY